LASDPGDYLYWSQFWGPPLLASAFEDYLYWPQFLRTTSIGLSFWGLPLLASAFEDYLYWPQLLGTTSMASTPGTTSIGLSSVGRHQVDLPTWWEATTMSLTLLCCWERLFDIYRFVCALYFIWY
jgi:hypothetical protein